MSFRPGLPGVLGEIAEAAGEAAAVALCRERGGREFTIPRRPEGSQLADIVEIEAARAIVAALGPGRITVPAGGWRGQGGRRRRAVEMMAAGASSSEIAAACDVTLRTVETWRAARRRAAGHASRQMSLPFQRPD